MESQQTIMIEDSRIR